MSPDPRRRPGTPSKGDLRQVEILDAAERRLALTGFEPLTIEAIASDVGISRASLYFYFRSKHDVLTALVARTMRELADGALAPSPPDDALDDVEAVRASLGATVAAWRQHGTVMQAAVDYGPVVPEIGRLWATTVDGFVQTMTPMVGRHPAATSSTVAADEVARALCWMTERTLYRARLDEADLDHAAEVCLAVWTSTLGLGGTATEG